MNDFISNMAYMISESGDTPSFDDIYTILKKTGTEPNEETMKPEDYAQLPDEAKREIHNAAMADLDEIGEIDPDIATAKYWEEYGMERDDDGNISKDDMKKLKSQSLQNKQNLKYHLFVCEKVTTWGDKYIDPGTGDEGQYSKSSGEIGTVTFDTKEEVVAAAIKRIKQTAKKNGVDTRNYRKVDAEALPEGIRDVDPNAFGYIYVDSIGEDKVVMKKRGRHAPDVDAEDDIHYGKLTKSFIFEYFIYRANSVIQTSGDGMAKLAQSMAKIGD